MKKSFKGTLVVEVGQQKNRAGQLPLDIEFVGEGDLSLQILGARLMDGSILDPVAVIAGKYYRHTVFSPALQLAIIKGGSEEAKTAAETEEARQKRLTEEANDRARRAGMKV